MNIIVTPLKKIPDERGSIYHILRSDSPLFTKFGEVYISTIYPGVIKAWHKHKEATLNFCCVSGTIRLAITNGEKVREVYIGDNNYCLVTIPKGLWVGFKGVGVKEALVLNFQDIPHYFEEIERIPPDSMDTVFNWKLEHK